MYRVDLISYLQIRKSAWIVCKGAPDDVNARDRATIQPEVNHYQLIERIRSQQIRKKDCLEFVLEMNEAGLTLKIVIEKWVVIIAHAQFKGSRASLVSLLWIPRQSHFDCCCFCKTSAARCMQVSSDWLDYSLITLNVLLVINNLWRCQ